MKSTDGLPIGKSRIDLKERASESRRDPGFIRQPDRLYTGADALPKYKNQARSSRPGDYQLKIAASVP